MAVRTEWVTLSGGQKGYFALPEGSGPFPGVVLFSEAFGLNEYIQSECRKLAAAGFAAIGPDLFEGQIFGYENMEPVYAKLKSFTDEGLLADARAGLEFLESRREVAKKPVGTVGFCMGGRLSVLTALEFGDRVGAAVSFYGGGIAPDEPRFFATLTDRLPSLKPPVMLLYGAEDASIGPSEHARLAKTLSEAKKEFTLSVYPGAGHGFASVDRAPAYRKAVADAAWEQTLAFFKHHLG